MNTGDVMYEVQVVFATFGNQQGLAVNTSITALSGYIQAAVNAAKVKVSTVHS